VVLLADMKRYQTVSNFVAQCMWRLVLNHFGVYQNEGGLSRYLVRWLSSRILHLLTFSPQIVYYFAERTARRCGKRHPLSVHWWKKKKEKQLCAKRKHKGWPGIRERSKHSRIQTDWQVPGSLPQLLRILCRNWMEMKA
jgi:hypothetical protein